MGRILRPAAAVRWMMPSLANMTPQYVETVLRGALTGSHVQQWELFDLMCDTWPELAACMQELREGVLGGKLTVEAFAEEGDPPTATALEKQKLVSAALRRMQPDVCADENDLDGTISDLIDAWFRGVTVLEVGWQQIFSGSHGRIVAPRSTWWAHPCCYGWTDGGRLGLRLQEGMIADFPRHRFLIGVHKAKSGSALGASCLRPLAWWWCAANFSADWLLNLAQIFGLPFRWANYDPNAPQATVDAICNMLQNMGSAAWAAFPAGTTLEMKHENVSADHSPQGELLDRADRYARLLLLGQTLSGSQDASKGGGKGFGAVEVDVKQARMDAAAKFVCSVLNTQLLPSICELNYGHADECPVASIIADNEGSLEEAQRDEILSRMMPLSVAYLRKKYKQPEPSPGEEISTPPASPAPTPPANAAEVLATKMERLAGIEDDAVFAKQFQQLIETL